MLATPQGQFLSQRTHPRLCLLRTAPSGDEGTDALRFTVEGPGLAPLELKPMGPGNPIGVRVHKDRFQAVAGDEEADLWFSDFLGEACRLVYMPDDSLRPVDPDWAPGHRVGLADGYPLHLTTEESLRDLNDRLARPTGMLTYRPNLVVRGGGPWEEDLWRVFRVGEAVFHLVKPCARCAVTTVDQGSGATGREPLQTLKTFRQWEGKLFFGQNAVIEESGRFRVGDNVHILETGDARPPLSA